MMYFKLLGTRHKAGYKMIGGVAVWQLLHGFSATHLQAQARAHTHHH